MIKLDIRIMGVKKRRELILSELEKLGLSEDIVIYDDRPNGGNAMYNARRAWLSPFMDCTHRLVLQDDLILCDKFTEILENCIRMFPEAVWTLFNSRLRAVRDTRFFRFSGQEIWGQAVVMPIKIISECFNWIEETLGKDYPHDDRGIELFLREIHPEIPVVTTAPSLIQHLCPTESQLGYNNRNKVSKVWKGENVTMYGWDNPDIKSIGIIDRYTVESEIGKMERRRKKECLSL